MHDRNGRTALHESAPRRFESVIQMLLDAEADVNRMSHYTESALHVSAENGHEAVVQMLLTAGADVNMMNKSTWSALHASAGNGHEAVVQMLLTAGADVNMMNVYKGSALHVSVENEHEAIVKMLLTAGADVNMTNDVNGTALHSGVRILYRRSACQEAIIKVLIAAGANLNASAWDGTALHICAKAGHVFFTQMLLAAGADVNILGKDNDTAPHVASVTGYASNSVALHEKMADFKKRNIDDVTALHLCAREVYKLTVQDMIDVRSKKRYNGRSTAEHEAVFHALLEAETDTRLKDGYALADLRSCALKGYETIVQPMLDERQIIELSWTVMHMDISYRFLSGIDINMLKYGKRPVLHVSVIDCDVAMMQLLLGAGSDVNLTNDKGESALLLMHTVECDIMIVQALLRAGAVVNMTDMNGCTALHYAVHTGNVSVVRLLVEAGADVNLRGSSSQECHTRFKNKTPLEIAVICSRHAISDYLLNLPNTCVD